MPLPNENVVYEPIKMTLQSLLLPALKAHVEHKFRTMELYTVAKDSLSSFLHSFYFYSIKYISASMRHCSRNWEHSLDLKVLVEEDEHK